MTAGNRSFRCQANSAKSEAVNTTIKVLIKMARGFRNIGNMIALIYLKCSDLVIPLHNRPQMSAEKATAPGRSLRIMMTPHTSTCTLTQRTDQEGKVSSEGTPAYRVIPTDLCNKVLYKKGFESIASSQDLGPKETNRIYHLRDSLEKQYMVIKSMEGGRVFRIHTDEGILSKGLACFVASILRREISIACEAIGQKPSLMFPQIERPALVLMGNGTYKYINNMLETTGNLFASVGCTEEDFETIAGEVNEREKSRGKGVSQYHRTPGSLQTPL